MTLLKTLMILQRDTFCYHIGLMNDARESLKTSYEASKLLGFSFPTVSILLHANFLASSSVVESFSSA